MLLERPDPPDAIVRSGSVTRWIEIADVYWTDAWAKDLNSYATPEELHEPIDSGLYGGMDETLALRFVKILKSKIGKRTYKAFREKYGPGYLVLSIMSPFFDSRNSVDAMKHHWRSSGEVENLGYFRGVFVICMARGWMGRWPIPSPN